MGFCKFPCYRGFGTFDRQTWDEVRYVPGVVQELSNNFHLFKDGDSQFPIDMCLISNIIPSWICGERCSTLPVSFPEAWGKTQFRWIIMDYHHGVHYSGCSP